jgi:serine protease 16
VNIRDGHATIGKMMNTSDGRSSLAQMFPQVKAHGADWLKTRDGQADFAGNGVVQFPSQSNDPSCTTYGCGIKQICEVMTGGEPSPPLSRLAALASHQAAAAIDSGDRDGGAPRRAHSWMDYWGWQTCTEFGFYQTCEVGSRCFFTQGLNLLSDDDAFCEAQWNITPQQIAASITATNEHYGAGRPDLAHNASRILYVNGNVDPWSGLSILKSPAPGLPVLEVEGASHHAWTHPSKAGDQQSVIDARATIRKQVSAWLAEA